MRHIKYLATVCIFCSPQLATAVEGEVHKYTAKADIAFNRSTLAAFDHSGKMVTHHVLPNGIAFADHNHTMGNVTVARMGPDGTIETYCTTDADSAKAWIAGEIGVQQNAPLQSPVMERKP